MGLICWRFEVRVFVNPMCVYCGFFTAVAFKSIKVSFICIDAVLDSCWLMLLQLYGLLGFMLNFTLIYDMMLMGF